jgi:hypothetical protein
MATDSGSIHDQPSRRVVDQRIRNRVIEHLELSSSFAQQIEYERTAQIYIPSELIAGWEDLVREDPSADPGISSVYSAEEVEALGRVHGAWSDAADALPADFPPLSQVQTMPEWRRWRDESISALTSLMLRGRMSEDHEA